MNDSTIEFIVDLIFMFGFFLLAALFFGLWQSSWLFGIGVFFTLISLRIIRK
jgi:hypothetical protein